MRFHSAVFLATLAITPVCAKHMKGSNSNEAHVITSNRPPEISFEGEGGKGDGRNVIGSSRLLRGGSFKAQHLAEAMIAAMASFTFIGAAVAVVVSGGDVGGGGGSGAGGGGIAPAPKATMAQRSFAPEGGPDYALWTAQDFALRSL
jgi:hypothetical protein